MKRGGFVAAIGAAVCAAAVPCAGAVAKAASSGRRILSRRYHRGAVITAYVEDGHLYYEGHGVIDTTAPEIIYLSGNAEHPFS